MPLHISVFGLTITSSWANGHATLWRALLEALAVRGHRVTFFERDVEYYARHRDLIALDGAHQLHLYPSWDAVAKKARDVVRHSDAAIVTSYCPDARAAAALVSSDADGLKVFYDLDTPVTLSALERGESVDYLPASGLAAFDLVLSYAGGPALAALRDRLQARRVASLYGSVDPVRYQPAPADRHRADAAYLGTYARDRQAALDTLFLEPARRRPALRFLLGGSIYPDDFPWTDNIWYVRHVPPSEHPSFYGSCRLTVNVTRGPMAAMGFCPSGRLFEATACGTAVLTDAWPGLEEFFEPGTEILIAASADEAIEALDRPAAELDAIGRRARRRTLASHTAARRAEELERMLTSV